MFQSYFQLQRRPFPSIPTPDQYFPAASIERARTALVGLIERQQGPAIVVGAVGLGKSLLCNLLAESFRHRCRTVILPSGRLCTRRALLQVFLYELGLPYCDLEEGELRLSLIDHITNKDLCPKGVVLLVDESDNLTMALLDELRSLTNLTCESEPAIRLIMFGSPRLEEKFAHPRLESFNQRLAGRFYLEPFTLDETADYVIQQFEDCGGDPHEVFADEALKSIHDATEGIPRLINQLADHVLVLATADERRQVDQQTVEEAWADLQQLPFPTHHRSSGATNDLPSDIIEFGQLDDPRGSAELNAESALDEISQQMSMIDAEAMGAAKESSDSNADDRVEPEVSLYFHEAHDPFGDGFDEEEVVVDNFVSPDAMSQRHRRQVRCEDSQEIAGQLGAQYSDLPGEPSETLREWNVIGTSGAVQPKNDNVDTPAVNADASQDEHQHVQQPASETPALPTPATEPGEPTLEVEALDNASNTPVVLPPVDRTDFETSPNDSATSEDLGDRRDPRPLDEVHPVADDGSDNNSPVDAGVWGGQDAATLADQGVHVAEFDLFDNSGEQTSEVEMVSIGPGVPEHVAGEVDADAAVPDDDEPECASMDQHDEVHPSASEDSNAVAETVPSAFHQDEPADNQDEPEAGGVGPSDAREALERSIEPYLPATLQGEPNSSELANADHESEDSAADVATATKRAGSDYRRLFSQLRSKRR